MFNFKNKFKLSCIFNLESNLNFNFYSNVDICFKRSFQAKRAFGLKRRIHKHSKKIQTIVASQVLQTVLSSQRRVWLETTDSGFKKKNPNDRFKFEKLILKKHTLVEEISTFSTFSTSPASTDFLKSNCALTCLIFKF